MSRLEVYGTFFPLWVLISCWLFLGALDLGLDGVKLDSGGWCSWLVVWLAVFDG